MTADDGGVTIRAKVARHSAVSPANEEAGSPAGGDSRARLAGVPAAIEGQDGSWLRVLALCMALGTMPGHDATSGSRLASRRRIAGAQDHDCLAGVIGRGLDLRHVEALAGLVLEHHEAGVVEGLKRRLEGRCLCYLATEANQRALLVYFTIHGIFTLIVNKQERLKIEGPFEANALRVLRRIPGLTVVTEPRGPDRGVDAVVRYAGMQKRVAVEVKRHANAATAWQLVRQAHARPRRPLLLIAGETTADARQILEDNGIAAIDGLGNAHVELPGLLVHLEGRGCPKTKSAGTRRTRLAGKAGVAAQALLLRPGHDWRVQELARDAGVSVGLAHQVLARLEEEAVVITEGAGPRRTRRVANPTALLDLWAEEHRDRLRETHGYMLAQTPQQIIRLMSTRLAGAGVDYALTGAAGASLVAPFVTALPVLALWIPATLDPEDLWRLTEASPAEDGHNITFLQADGDAGLVFREQVAEAWIANRFRLYVDLLDDPRRGREQADNLRREVIGF